MKTPIMMKVATAPIGAIVGAVRSGGLNEKERMKIKKHYGLGRNASLGWRNAGRGAVGGFLGALPGSFLSSAALRSGNLPAASVGSLAALIGGAAGGYINTNKYSKKSPALEKR